MFPRTRLLIVGLAVALGSVVVSAAPVLPVAPNVLADGAILVGKITFEGDAPERQVIDLEPDPVCSGLHSTPERRHGIDVDKDGGLAHVFVQLTKGVPDTKYQTPSEPVVLDQRGCRYHPHVFGVMKKQKIEIVNSDATLHNIHAMPKRNKEFNTGMPMQGMRVPKKFKKAEEAIRIKCDVHPWMQAFCFSMEHPYFATTASDGSFRMRMDGLPAGEYGVKLWHEVLGEFEGTVTLTDDRAEFEYTWKAP